MALRNTIDVISAPAHLFFLLKGVEAVAVHGGKEQEEREASIAAFKAGRKDVLVATDVASKGLDFPDIQVCYSQPLTSEPSPSSYVWAFPSRSSLGCTLGTSCTTCHVLSKVLSVFFHLSKFPDNWVCTGTLRMNCPERV